MNGHLNDDELQQFAIKPDELNRFALAHIAGCEHCQIKAKQYAQITGGLKDLQKMTVELDMAAFAMPVKPKMISLSDVTIAASVIAGLLIIAAGTAAMGPDIRALLLTGKTLHFYLLPTLALILLTAGATFYYKQYKQQLTSTDLLN